MTDLLNSLPNDEECPKEIEDGNADYNV